VKTIYVTGATGILGANVCTQLIAKGFKARASVRDMAASDAIALRDAGVEVVPGDLKDRASLAKAIEGADGVIHSGAMLGRPGATWEEGYATNVVGTMNLLSAAWEAGNMPVVQVLTTTFFDSSKTFSEDSALDLTCAFMDVYTVTKRLAYLEGTGRVREGQDIRFMVPGAIYGPSICVEKANWANTFNDRFIKALTGQMPTQLPLPMPWSTADDCAFVCVAALEKGEAGTRYVAHGSPDSTGTVATVMNRACELAGVDHRIGEYTKDELDSPELLEIFGPTIPLLAKRTYPEPFSTSYKTQEALGYVPTELGEGVETMISWLREVKAI
jgi:dihydroflavonol-4-reductase